MPTKETTMLGRVYWRSHTLEIFRASFIWQITTVWSQLPTINVSDYYVFLMFKEGWYGNQAFEQWSGSLSTTSRHTTSFSEDIISLNFQTLKDDVLQSEPTHQYLCWQLCFDIKEIRPIIVKTVTIIYWTIKNAGLLQKKWRNIKLTLIMVNCL